MVTRIAKQLKAMVGLCVIPWHSWHFPGLLERRRGEVSISPMMCQCRRLSTVMGWYKAMLVECLDKVPFLRTWFMRLMPALLPAQCLQPMRCKMLLVGATV